MIDRGEWSLPMRPGALFQICNNNWIDFFANMATNVNKCKHVEILAITGSLAVNSADYQEMNCKFFVR